MPESSPQSPPPSQASAVPSWKQIAALAGLFAALYCINIFIPRDLWIQDEARYGEVVREMLATGQWLIPHLNGHFYPDKPALYFWLVAAVGGIVGQGVLAFRLVTLFSTAAAVYGVWLVGRRLGELGGNNGSSGGVQLGLWSAALFASSFLTLFVGQMARMDMLLTASIIFAWYTLLGHWYRPNEGKRSWSLVGFWFFAILGVAIKGPIALLFSVLPALAWFAHEDGWRGLRRLRPLLGLASLIAVVGAWVGAIVAGGHGHYLWEIWHNQLVGRAVHSWSHREPIYFYLLLAPLLLMPWSGLVVQGGYRLWRERLTAWRPVVWFALLPLAAVSLISGKLPIYIEPLFPAMCVAAAFGATRVWRAPRASLWVSLPPVVFMVGLVVAVFIVNRTYFQSGTAGYVLVGILAILAIVGLILAFVSGRLWLLGWNTIFVGVSICVFGVLVFLLNPDYSGRPIGEAIARLAPAGTPVGVVNTTRGILNYYAKREMTELEIAQAPKWWNAHPNALMIIKTQDLPGILRRADRTLPCRVNLTYGVEITGNHLKQYHLLMGCPVRTTPSHSPAAQP